MNKFIGVLLILVLAASCKNETEPIVKITTEYGDIKIRLYDKTPKHRDNFLKLVDEKFYDGLLFHRVINHFMIQGGDPTSKNAGPDVMLGEGDVDYRIDAEFVPEYFHKKGVLAAAREGDDTNPERKSSGAQFYIVQGKVYSPEQLEATVKVYTTVGGTPHLDGQYTVFGEVIEGLEIVDKIAAVKTSEWDRPVEDVMIKRVRVAK